VEEYLCTCEARSGLLFEGFDTSLPPNMPSRDINITVEVYRTRVNVMLDNVQRWIPADQEPLKQIRVSIGFNASLPVEVNRFVPVDAVLLQQANLRKSAEDELPLSPWRVEPYGLHGIISHAELNKFLEDMICQTENHVLFYMIHHGCLEP
jgi:hypothetical protein